MKGIQESCSVSPGRKRGRERFLSGCVLKITDLHPPFAAPLDRVGRKWKDEGKQKKGKCHEKKMKGFKFLFSFNDYTWLQTHYIETHTNTFKDTICWKKAHTATHIHKRNTHLRLCINSRWEQHRPAPALCHQEQLTETGRSENTDRLKKEKWRKKKHQKEKGEGKKQENK